MAQQLYDVEFLVEKGWAFHCQMTMIETAKSEANWLAEKFKTQARLVERDGDVVYEIGERPTNH